jgi:two-component system heavy metal sensor histidine kinase CusS
MTLSLRQRLLLRVVPAVAVVQIISGALLNKFVSDDLHGRLDDRLLERATSLTGEVEVRPVGIYTDLEEFEQANQLEGNQVELVQVLGPSGAVHFLSTLRQGKALAAPSPSAGELAYSTMVLEDGRKLRCVHLGFHPEFDDEEAGPDSDPIRRDPQTTLTLTVARDMTALDHDLASFRLMLVMAVSATILILIVTLLVLIRATLSPLETLASQIAGLDPVCPDQIPPDRRIPEDFRPIVDRLNELLVRVRKALEREKTFTADFAHEMRTPVAGLRSTLEVGLTRERTPAEYQDMLSECLDMSMGLQSLTESMLTLRRLENGSAQPGSERIPVAELVNEVALTLIDAARARDMVIEAEIDQDLVLRTDRSLVRLAISNLMGNAVAHGAIGSTITVRGAYSRGSVSLEFRNPGGPATQEEALTLRDRFRRGDPSRDATVSHFGLGLALVDAIAHALGFQVEIRIPTVGVFAVQLLFPQEFSDPRET